MRLREIASELNEKGVPTTRGGKWYAGSLNIYWKILFKLIKRRTLRIISLLRQSRERTS